MFTTIEKAIENFCIHQLRESYSINKDISQKRTLIAYIDIDAEDATKHRVYIASDFDFMQRISLLFIEEEKSDEETLIDMTLETANLIIGSARVLSEEGGKNPYTIGTPFFEKIGKFDFDFDDAKTIVVGEDEITIAIKEIHV